MPGEEADAHALLKGRPRTSPAAFWSRRLSALAVRYLLAEPRGAGRRPAAPRARGRLPDATPAPPSTVANLIARDSITVAADPTAVVEVFESYPYGEGVGEFTQANAGCERIVLADEPCLSPAAARAASRLRDGRWPRARRPRAMGRRLSRWRPRLPPTARRPPRSPPGRAPTPPPRWPPWPRPCRPRPEARADAFRGRVRARLPSRPGMRQRRPGARGRAGHRRRRRPCEGRAGRRRLPRP